MGASPSTPTSASLGAPGSGSVTRHRRGQAFRAWVTRGRAIRARDLYDQMMTCLHARAISGRVLRMQHVDDLVGKGVVDVEQLLHGVEQLVLGFVDGA